VDVCGNGKRCSWVWNCLFLRSRICTRLLISLEDRLKCAVAKIVTCSCQTNQRESVFRYCYWKLLSRCEFLFLKLMCLFEVIHEDWTHVYVLNCPSNRHLIFFLLYCIEDRSLSKSLKFHHTALFNYVLYHINYHKGFLYVSLSFHLQVETFVLNTSLRPYTE